jgi:hypothetical protein
MDYFTWRQGRIGGPQLKLLQVIQELEDRTSSSSFQKHATSYNRIVCLNWGLIRGIMSSPRIYSITAAVLFLFATPALGKVEIKDHQHVETETQQEGDRKPALKYFQRSPAQESSGSSEHFLALHLGGYVDSESYKWGASDYSDAGKLTVGLTYRMGEWTKTMDLFLRVDFSSFEIPDDKQTKMSVMPLVLFPEASSKFPLYFGVGAGLGVFFKQLRDESALSLDYQLVAGLRLFDVLDSVGFNFEMGLKNHFHLLSDGQFNGVFAAAGVIFSF